MDKLKAELMILAGWLAPEEQMTAEDGALSVQDMVRRMAASKGIGFVKMALLAQALAAYVDTK